MPQAPVDILIDGEPFEDIDGWLCDNEEALDKESRQALDDVVHGRRTSAYIGGGHLPVYFICAERDPDPLFYDADSGEVER